MQTWRISIKLHFYRFSLTGATTYDMINNEFLFSSPALLPGSEEAGTICLVFLGVHNPGAVYCVCCNNNSHSCVSSMSGWAGFMSCWLCYVTDQASDHLSKCCTLMWIFMIQCHWLVTVSCVPLYRGCAQSSVICVFINIRDTQDTRLVEMDHW